MARLRAPDGCPWDREQDHKSLAICLIEECAELLDTIDRADSDHMREELGDVLLQVVFHAHLAAERGEFTFDDVARGISDKLIRRHPHVFGEGRLETSGQVIQQWEAIKAQEKGAAPAPTGLKPIPPALPALLFAYNVHKQLAKRDLAAAAGVDVAAVARLADGLDEASAGRLLYLLAAACRERGVDPESALRREAKRVADRAEAALRGA